MTEQEYEPPIPDPVWHAAMRWNAPLSEAHAAVLLDAFEPERAAQVLDLGCGWGELLLRAVQRSPTLTGRGVDTDATALAHGAELAADRGLGDRVTLLDAPAESWSEPVDRLICVGASHVWGGTEQALTAWSQLVTPGGRLLYGDGFLQANPSALTRELFGEMLPFDGVLAAARGAGWRVLHFSASDQLEWDEFESTYRAGPERWLLANPEAEDASGIRGWLDRRLLEYVEGYRGELGFCWLVLGRG